MAQTHGKAVVEYQLTKFITSPPPRPRHHPHILVHIDGDAPESGDDIVGQGGALTVDRGNVVIVVGMQTGFCPLETPPLLCQMSTVSVMFIIEII
jgi:hypothetical protein